MKQDSFKHKLTGQPIWRLAMLALVVLLTIAAQQGAYAHTLLHTLLADVPPAGEDPNAGLGYHTYLPLVAANGAGQATTDKAEDGPAVSAAGTNIVNTIQALVTALVNGSDTRTLRNPTNPLPVPLDIPNYGKPNQSRIWYNSAKNRWDALIPKLDTDSSSDHYIMKDIRGSQSFTSVELEDRDYGRPDVFWDDANKKLYVLSSHPVTSKFWRLSYNVASDSYNFEVGALGTGVVVPGITHPNDSLGGNSPASLYVTSNGNVWAAVMKTDSGLQVQRSTDGGATWLAAPATLNPAAKVGLTTWSNFTFNGKTYVGVFAGENGEANGGHPLNTKFFFWYIDQSADPANLANWVNDTPNIPQAEGIEQADDHVNAARDADGNSYFVVKTESGGPLDPLIKLYKRTPAGVWTPYKVTETRENPEESRPSIMIDEQNRLLTIYTNGSEIVSPTARNGVRKKVVSLDHLDDLAAASFVTMFDGNTQNKIFTDIIAPRQAVNTTSGIVTLAHNRTDQTVWYNSEAVVDYAAIIPNVVGLPQAAAQQAIVDAHLKVGNISFQINETVPSGEVLGQSPVAGNVVAQDTSIALVVSSGSSSGSTSTITANSIQDTGIREHDANKNFGSADKVTVKSKAGDKQQALFQFNLSSMPAGANVKSAIVRLFVENDSRDAVRVHRITSAWSESGATWSNAQAIFDPTPVTSFTPSKHGLYIAVDVTALVQQWVNGSVPNYGLMLVSSSEQDSQYFTRETGNLYKRPLLDVTFTSSTVVTKVGVAQDTFVSQKEASKNFGGNDKIEVKLKSKENEQGLIQFDLSAVPAGAIVTSAAVNFNVDSDSKTPVRIHRVTNAWTEYGATWNNIAVAYDPNAVTSFTPFPKGQFYTADITALVQQWVNGSQPNYGLMLIGSSEDDAKLFSREKNSATLQPFLQISYTGVGSRAIAGSEQSAVQPPLNTLYLPIITK